MAQIPYRANLSAATFPLTVAKAGRSVIVPGPDQNYDRRVDPPGEGLKGTVGIPQALYLENVIPTYDGYQSVGFKAAAGIPSLSITNRRLVHVLQTSVRISSTQLGQYTIYFVDDDTVKYNSGSLDVGVQQTASLPIGFKCPVSPSAVSLAVAQGRTFCLILNNTPAVKIYELTDGGTLTFSDVSGTIAGVTLANLIYIASAFNYLVAVSRDAVFWSSTTDPLDFAPSNITGAGTENISQLASEISLAINHPAGFIIYSQDKAIGAAYTGNRAYPWRFYEVKNSGGALYSTDVHGGTNTAIQFITTPSGQIQTSTLEAAVLGIADVSDYLQNNRYNSTYNSTTNIITTVPVAAGNLLNDRFRTAIYYLLDRYVIISYIGVALAGGATAYDYALIYDVLLNRLGRIKFHHTNIVESAGKIFFIVGYDPTLSSGGGKIYKLYTDIADQNIGTYVHSGVLILGKFEYVRNRFITLEGLDLECVQSGLGFGTTLNHSVAIIPSLDGKTLLTSVAPTLKSYSEFLAAYNAHVSAKSFCIAIEGAFDLSTIDMVITVDGRG